MAAEEPDRDRHGVRLVDAGELDAVGRLAHEFNEEFEEETPGPEVLAGRIGALVVTGEMEALLAGEGPDGFALLQFQATIWSAQPNCYLAELYVVPGRRGEGIGRALMDAALARARERGAGHMDLNTSEVDTAARGLYEGLGFANTEGGEDGPRMLYYERDL
jgi:ribosomal protein S18 acetylase RimI-like enzyme